MVLKIEEIEKFLEKRGGEMPPDQLVTRIRDHLHQLASPIWPRQTAAVAIGKEKTAALLFDRIWSPFTFLVPERVRFSGTNIIEETALVHVSAPDFMASLKDLEYEDRIESIHKRLSTSLVSDLTFPQVDAELKMIEEGYRPLSRTLAEFLTEEYKIQIIPIYSSQKARDSEYQEGDIATVIAILSKLELPDEDSLEWTQVNEFRKDDKSRQKVRRLMYWLDNEMIGKPQTYIEDCISLRLEDYQKALKKHAIKTTLATVAGTLSAVSIPTIITQIQTQPLWMSLLQGIMIGGSTIAKVVEKHIDSKPSPPREIAWVYELKRKTT